MGSRPEFETTHLLFVVTIPQTRDLTHTHVIKRDSITKTNPEDERQDCKKNDEEDQYMSEILAGIPVDFGRYDFFLCEGDF